jgi:addiction module RelE/StbE family toxin
VTNLIWGGSFKRAYKRVAAANPDLKPRIAQALETVVANPHHPSLRTHKLSGKLRGLWAFVVAYDCRIVFQFLDEQNILLIDIGKHDEVY